MLETIEGQLGGSFPEGTDDDREAAVSEPNEGEPLLDRPKCCKLRELPRGGLPSDPAVIGEIQNLDGDAHRNRMDRIVLPVGTWAP